MGWKMREVHILRGYGHYVWLSHHRAFHDLHDKGRALVYGAIILRHGAVAAHILTGPSPVLLGYESCPLPIE